MVDGCETDYSVVLPPMNISYGQGVTPLRASRQSAKDSKARNDESKDKNKQKDKSKSES